MASHRRVRWATPSRRTGVDDERRTTGAGKRRHNLASKGPRSVITFGAMRILDDTEKKTWFFDRGLAEYGQPDWTFQSG
jgi:hypothetical protein